MALPRWLTERGGWEADDAPKRFAAFVEGAPSHLGDVVARASTLNEPNVAGVMGCTLGEFPPIATDDDRERVRYMSEVLQGVLRCLRDGVDVRGYFAWSLLDNFEWAHGYRPRFGLYEVDRRTFERRPKPSARWFGEVARANSLTV